MKSGCTPATAFKVELSHTRASHIDFLDTANIATGSLRSRLRRPDWVPRPYTQRIQLRWFLVRHHGDPNVGRHDHNTANLFPLVFRPPAIFKFVCLVHADMTGLVHVVNLSEALPHDQEFYDRQARSERALLSRRTPPPWNSWGTPKVGDWNGGPSSDLAAGLGLVLTTNGAGRQTASLMRFARETIEVQVGDTVEWRMLDPSINHTVTFGNEPADPRPASANVTLTSDGARQATIRSTADDVNSGFLSATPQDRAGLAQAPPNVTRFLVTFTSPGTFDYICAVHDQLGMKGTVIVH